MEGFDFETLVGRFAAIGCGFGMAHFGYIAGFGAGGIAGIVALCLLALADGAVSTP